MITIEEFKKKQSVRSRLIGIDLGSKIIGIAVCDQNQKVATPFKTLNRNKLSDLVLELKQIIEENDIGGIVIGNPINMDGSFGKSSQSTHDISEYISKNINLPLCLWDERLSTVGAFNLTSQLDVNVNKREKK